MHVCYENASLTELPSISAHAQQTIMEGVLASSGEQDKVQQTDDSPTYIMGHSIPSWVDDSEIQYDE